MGNAPDFDADFWPNYPRKTAKAHARVMWNRLTSSEKFAATHALPVHVRFWELVGTAFSMIPHAGTWLNPELGRRWEDELEMPEAPEALQWWKTASGIEAKARQAGVVARPGEGHHELKARILAKERAA